MGNSKESNRKREGTFPICGKEHWLLFSMLFYSAHSSSNGRSGCSERWEGCKCLRPANDLQLPLRSGNSYLVAMGLLHPFFCILCFFSWRKRFQKYLCHCIMECKKLVLPGFLSLHTGLYYKALCACSSSLCAVWVACLTCPFDGHHQSQRGQWSMDFLILLLLFKGTSFYFDHPTFIWVKSERLLLQLASSKPLAPLTLLQ